MLYCSKSGQIQRCTERTADLVLFAVVVTAGGEAPSQAEVRDLDGQAVGKQDVSSRQITMNDLQHQHT